MTKKKSRAPEVALCILVIFAVVTAIIVAILLNGNTKITDTNPDNTTISSVTCKNTGSVYPIYKDLAAPLNETTTINLIYSGEKVKEVGLEYVAGFGDTEKAKSFDNFALVDFLEALDHAGINNTDAFSNQITQKDDKVYLTLNMNSNDINKRTVPFIFITLNEDDSVPRTVSEFKKVYTGLGFKCQDN